MKDVKRGLSAKEVVTTAITALEVHVPVFIIFIIYPEIP